MDGGFVIMVVGVETFAAPWLVSGFCRDTASE